jgi:hypothetical protein
MIQKTPIARKTCNVAICAALVAWAGMSVAAETRSGEYKPSEILGLDLPTAVLSPKPLGPTAQFAPVAIEDASGDAGHQARAEPSSVPDSSTAEASALDKTAADNNVAEKAAGRARIRTAMVVAHAEKPRGEARVKLAKRHGNPLDAQAFDTRVQVWPCKSGGICNWQRQ